MSAADPVLLRERLSPSAPVVLVAAALGAVFGVILVPLSLIAALVVLVSMVWLMPTWLTSSLAGIYVMALVVLAHHWVGQNRARIEAAQADDRGHPDDEQGR